MDTHLQLLSRYHRHGDAEAFTALVREHAGMVYATAKRVTEDAALAEDVAQETFLELTRCTQGTVKSVAAWLHRVAWRKACNILRGESRRRRHEQVASVDLSSGMNADAGWEEMEPQIDAVLNELPATLRELLVAHYLEGCTQQVLAERTGASQSTVSRQLEAGIRELRTLLRSRGVMCGAGLAVLMSEQGAQASVPATLSSSLGKLALSGTGSSAALPATSFAPATLLAMSATTKILIVAATAAAAISLPLVLKQPGSAPAVQTATPKREMQTPSVMADQTPPMSAQRHYRPAAVSAQVRQKVEAILRRHQGMTKEQLKKSRELNQLMDRFIAAMAAPEFEPQIEERISALPAQGERGLVKMEFDMLDDAKGHAWLEAVVADDAQLMQDWVLNTLDGAIFEFAMEPGLQRSSNGVSVQAAPSQSPVTEDKDE